MGKDKIVVINVYNPPTTKIDETAYRTLFEHPKTILVGDFNAKNPLWKHKKMNEQGIALEKLTMNTNYVILNTASPTYQKKEV